MAAHKRSLTPPEERSRKRKGRAKKGEFRRHRGNMTRLWRENRKKERVEVQHASKSNLNQDCKRTKHFMTKPNKKH